MEKRAQLSSFCIRILRSEFPGPKAKRSGNRSALLSWRKCRSDVLLLALRSPLRRVYRVLEVLAGLEADVLRRRNRDLLVRAGVAAFARLALRDREAAEAGDRAALSALARLRDVADERVERGRRFLFRDAGLLGDLVDDVTLSCHKRLPPVCENLFDLCGFSPIYGNHFGLSTGLSRAIFSSSRSIVSPAPRRKNRSASR